MGASPLCKTKYDREKLQSLDPDLIMNPHASNLLAPEPGRPAQPTPRTAAKFTTIQAGKGKAGLKSKVAAVLKQSVMPPAAAQLLHNLKTFSAVKNPDLTLYISHRNQTHLDKL